VFDWLNIAYTNAASICPNARLDARIPAADPRFIELLDKMNLPGRRIRTAAEGSRL